MLTPVSLGPAPGWALGCSRRGSAHQHIGKPCQDACSIWSSSYAGRPYIVAAVADGHGDSRHDLSQYGSAHAVRSATDELSFMFWRWMDTEDPMPRLKAAFRMDFPRLVGRRWREAVRNDAVGRGLDAKELASRRLLSRYGTTLLTAMVTDDAVLVSQLGDGNILFLGSSGSVEELFPEGSDEVGEGTYSLCSKDASRLFRTAIYEPCEEGVLLLATDGFAKSFAPEEFTAALRNMSGLLKKHGPSEVGKHLPERLDYYSSEGSGDDISVVMLGLAAAQTDTAVNGSDSTAIPDDQEDQSDTSDQPDGEIGDSRNEPQGQEEAR